MFVNTAKQVARARTRRLDVIKASLTSDPSGSVERRNSGYGEPTTHSGSRRYSTRHGVIKINRTHRGHFRIQSLPSYSIPVRRQMNSEHNTLRRPDQRSDIAGIIVQFQTVSPFRENIPDVRLIVLIIVVVSAASPLFECMLNILARIRVSRCSVFTVYTQEEKRSGNALGAYRIRAIRSKTPTRDNAVNDKHRLTPATAGDNLP